MNFRWFAEDWVRAKPPPAAVPGHDREYLVRGRYTLGTLPYDWAFNRHCGLQPSTTGS